MPPMRDEPTADPLPYRVTLFFGPDQVEGKPSTSACVFNVKKRSWKGGIQIAVEITQGQIESSRTAVDFDRWLAGALISLPAGERESLTDRAHDLFAQAVCRCKLDLLLQTGLAQENQGLASGTLDTEFLEAVRGCTGFITSYVASELDLPPTDSAPL
jgi:hypothetical protein